VVIATNIKRTGARSWRINPTTASRYFQYNPAANRAVFTSRFYVYYDTLPSGTSSLHEPVVSAGTKPQVRVTSGGLIQYRWGTGTATTHPTTLAADTWYCIDIRYDLSTGTKTIDVRVDGVAGTQNSLSEAAADMSSLRFGNVVTTISTDLYMDDLVVTDSASDYPIGAGAVQPVYVAACGTHSFTLGDFENSSSVDLATNETTSYQVIDESPMTETGGAVVDYVKQVVIRTTGYLEYTLASLGWTGAPRAVSISSAVAASSVAASNAGLKFNDGGTEDAVTLRSTGNPALTTVRHNWKTLSSKPTGGAWTNTAFANGRLRWGYSNDVTPNPYLEGLIAEAEVPASVDAAAEHASGTGAASIAVPHEKPNAGNAAATGTSYVASTNEKPSIGNAAGTGAVSTTVANVGAATGHSAGAGAAADATDKVSPTSGAAAGAGVANDISVAQFAAPEAGLASGAGAAAAQQSSELYIIAASALALDNGSQANPTTSIGAIALAGHASGRADQRDFTADPAVSIRSSDPVYATARTGGTLHVLDDVEDLEIIVGQTEFDGTVYVYEGFLEFPTETLAGSTVTDAVLSTYELGGSRLVSGSFTLQALGPLEGFDSIITTADWVSGDDLDQWILVSELASSEFISEYSGVEGRYDWIGNVDVVTNGPTQLLLHSDQQLLGNEPETNAQDYGFIARPGHPSATDSAPRLSVTVLDFPIFSTSAPHIGHASGTGAAYDATGVPAVSVSDEADSATGTGTAHLPTITVAGEILAVIATGTGAAHNASTVLGLSVAAGRGTGTGTAFGTDVTRDIYVVAGHAAGTGIAKQPKQIRMMAYGGLTVSDTFRSMLVVEDE
jgi:hypothetical protein